ncbi:ferredoxin [Kitasatospora sp. NBC_01287]|uniref:ferredoxin n=1 Tax=Kitasatospora sp. NBC_01287 TaxID=2903573 RepID=UPI00224D07DE|nr:ferredoxin [Kitasatospora sp. NBC_01287]MCX4751614.1 ferredoxin [Kitasatospora sp. NBC_01287]
MVSAARVTADRERCISGGRCMATAGEVFDQDEEGIVVVLTPEPPADLHEAVREAAYLCPARAIRFTESTTAVPRP